MIKRLLVLTAAAAAAAALIAAPPAQAIVGGFALSSPSMQYLSQVDTAAGSCTGTLMSPNWVLTVAHCSVPATVGDMAVRAGNRQYGTGGQYRQVVRIVANPAYTGGFNDLALLQVNPPITGITVPRLGVPSEAAYWDGVNSAAGPDQGIAIGWGATSSAGGNASSLQYRWVWIFGRVTPAPGAPPILPASGAVCFGDSGSPLMVPATGGELVVAGVAKAGNCGDSSQYSFVGEGANRTWVTSGLLPMPYTPFGARDWDHDGHQDLIVRQDSTGDLFLYLGASNRNALNTNRIRIGNGWNATSPFGMTDWDRDGAQDIIERNETTGELWIYPGQNVRGYSQIQPTKVGSSVMAGYTPAGLGDIDGDGHQDLVLYSSQTGSVVVYAGASIRSPSNSSSWTLARLRSATPFGIADWDRDGRADLILRNNDSGDLWLYPGQNNRSTITAAPVRIGNGWNGYSPFGITDWDKDGSQDILTRRDSDGALLLYPGQSVRGYSQIQPVRIGSNF